MRILIAARNTAIGVEGRVVVAPEGPFDLVLRFDDADVRPGLINAHDHLHRNHYGRLGRPTYENARDWARDVELHDARSIAEGRRMPRREALLTGAWKNLFAGVTSVLHHDPWEPDFDLDFPLRVVRVPSADSLRRSPAIDLVSDYEHFSVHLAEGVDEQAADEVRDAERIGLLRPGLIAVHGVGMDADAVNRFRASGAALTWCPTSNLFLFDRTAPQSLLREGLDVLLGSDSLLSAEGNLLDEMRCARRLGLLSDERLEAATGATAARRLGIPTPSLEPGAPADLFLCTKPLLQARAEDVLMVMVGGEIRLAAPGLQAAAWITGHRGRQLSLNGVTRWIDGDAPTGRRPVECAVAAVQRPCAA